MSTTATSALLPHHAAQLEASGIAPEHIAARGYRSVTSADELAALGFPDWQAKLVPALVIPWHGVIRDTSTYQIKPDNPRTKPDGDGVLKYEHLAGGPQLIDCPPLMRDQLEDPSIPLVFTEGVKKADSAASHGLLVLSLNGVFGFRGRNAKNGVTALADFEAIPLPGRDVLIIYDSDVSVKAAVRKAQKRLAKFLAARKAKVSIIDLPDGPDGEKTGLDDWFVRGGTVEQLRALARPWDSADPGRKDYPRTQLGLAERLADAYGDRLRYSPALGWVAFDGKRWETNAEHVARRWLARVVRDLLREAAEIDDPDDRHDLLAYQRRCERKGEMDGALWHAESILYIRREAFDRRPFLFNVQNGTVNLETGQLQPHNPDDMLTRISPVTFDPKARCPTFIDFITTITKESAEPDAKPRPELVDFLRKYAGYTLTDDVREQIIVLLVGVGSNGKSTLREILQYICGEYAETTGAETFMVKRAGGIPNDLAALAGARMVAISESNAGAQLASGLVKLFTGGDTISARFLHREFFNFIPTGKVWLSTNNPPVIRDTSHAMWRRIRLLPFDVVIPNDQQDKQLPAKLRAEASGILNWMLAGCRDWLRDGLEPPDIVQAATDAYRADQDILGPWLAACCERDARAASRSTALYTSFRSFAEQAGEKEKEIPGSKRFAGLLREHGIASKHDRSGTYWLGIRLRDDGEPSEAPETEPETPACDTSCDTSGSVTLGDTKNQVFSTNARIAEKTCKNPSPSVTSHEVSHDVSPITLIDRPEQLPDVLRAIETAPRVALDVETTGLNPRRDRVRLIQLSTPGRSCPFVIDTWKVDPALLNPLYRLLEQRELVGHSIGFDLAFLDLAPKVAVDTQLLGQVLDYQRPKHGATTLAAMAKKWLGRELDKTEQTSDWTGELSSEQLQYAGLDATIVLELAAKLETELAAAKLSDVAKLENACVPAVAWMSRAGVPVDAERWRLAVADIQPALIAAEAAVRALAPELDAKGLRSPKQLLAAFRAAGVDLPDVAKETLAACAHPLAAALLDYRDVATLDSSFGESWLEHVAADGRAYPHWRQHGTEPGRMSCDHPNLQQLPKRGAWRAAIRPPDGRVIVRADYSQIELRIAAQVTQDPALLTAFRNGVDIHTATSAGIRGVAPEQVTPDDRQLAKAANFGLLFGAGADRLAQLIRTDYQREISDHEAAELRTKFFQTYRGLAAWHRSIPDRPVDTYTLLGRRRRRVLSYTEKLNSPIQGSGADILKSAMVRLYRDRGAVPSARLILAVHDELVLECDAADAPAAADWLTRHMLVAGEKQLPDVPVLVEAAIRRSWGGE